MGHPPKEVSDAIFLLDRAGIAQQSPSPLASDSTRQ